MKKPSLLIVYDYFYPGFKAGGPIQSLTNLLILLQPLYTISVVTSAYDLNSDKPYDDVALNNWNKICLSPEHKPIEIWYDNKSLTLKTWKFILGYIKPDVVYLNGIFSYNFFIKPLIALNSLRDKLKVIICPRGMLQKGALDGKSIKKKLYINTLKISRLVKVAWHATNAEEYDDIKKMFGNNQDIIIASNIPKKPVSQIKFPSKQQNSLKLIYLSLIAEKKNLFFLLEIISKCDKITLDVYGPIKDKNYWEACKVLIAQMPGKVRYVGEVSPINVQDTFKEYDASILLTKGENFGHALYESLSAGRPLITSHFTPWQNLQERQAGWNISISKTADGINLLKKLSAMSAESFNGYCSGAYSLATEYFTGLNSLKEYQKLFEVK